MTQREEVKFKVYTKSSINITGTSLFPFQLIDFIEGDGTYDTTTYKYSVQNAGTYLLGVSYNKRQLTNNGVCDIRVDRVVDGVSTSRVINRSQEVNTGTYLTINPVLMYKLEVGDEIYCRASYGNPLTNLNSYTSDDTLNSFWGIRLDY
jgi:hypothetical protein